MDKIAKQLTALLLTVFTITACAPISSSNPPTGNIVGPVAGAAAGGGLAALFGGTNSVIALSGLGGAGLGYYLTTARFAANGIISAGGQVFTQGDFATIEVPTDRLFEVNTAEFLPGSTLTLDSIVSVLNRYPCNNILISGNTSGFGTSKYEHTLSEDRAKEIAAYLWVHGITSFQPNSFHQRKLMYVGFGNYFPIANNIQIKSIRSNSRIQITAYPTTTQLQGDTRFKTFNNIGGSDESSNKKPAALNSDTFASDHMPDGSEISSNMTTNQEVSAPKHATENHDYTPDVNGEFSDTIPDYNKVESARQTTPGLNVEKQGGYKGEGDLKDEGGFKDESPR